MAATPAAKRAQRVSWSLAALAITLMAGEWILLVAGTKRDEMIVGAVSVTAATLFLRLVHQASTLRLQFTAADIATAWRIPWYILTDVYLVSLILFKDLLGIRRAESLYRVCGFSTGKDDPRLVTRRVLATVFTTATPSIIVVGIDYAQSRMLFHQLQRGSVPKMTQELGGKP